MIVGLVNQKGGVGKTTLSVSLAFEAILRGFSVLLVDADPQQSIMEWSDKRIGSLPLKMGIVSMPKKTLHRDLRHVTEGFDLVIIDSPPRVTDIARSVMLACDLIIVPILPSAYDVWATHETLEVIRDAQLYNKHMQCVFTINRKIVNTAIGRDVREALESLGEDVMLLKTEIHQRVVYAESAMGGSIHEMGSDAKALLEISQLFEEAGIR